MVVHVVRLEPPEFDMVELHGKPFKIHSWAKCKGEACTFHNPSEHHMVDWPLVCRSDKYYLMERVCEHGVGHPDPDSIDSIIRRGVEQGRDREDMEALAVHGCDGCCRVAASTP